VTSVTGLDGKSASAYLRVCPGCTYPSVVRSDGSTIPGLPYGDDVKELSDDLGALYEEARQCAAVNASHAVVMLARKLLMHVAVDHEAEKGKTFAFYLDYLEEHGLIPPNTKDWIDELRELGNEANHEIRQFSVGDAHTALDFAAMLLKLLYEYPARGRASVAARKGPPAEGGPR
jgi:hypothetical protein